MLIRIATRRSQLALAQSRWVKAQLEALEPGLTVELREYVTRGDQIQNVPLAQVGGKGLFTKEIEDACRAALEGTNADFAPPHLTVSQQPIRHVDGETSSE